MRRGAAAAAAALAAAALAAWAGGAGAATPGAGSWTIRFFSETTTPKADAPWSYCVLVVEPKAIKAVRAKVTQRLFDAQGNPIGDVGSASILGAWCQAIKLPASIKGQPITLETKVVANGIERRLRTPVTVR